MRKSAPATNRPDCKVQIGYVKAGLTSLPCWVETLNHQATGRVMLPGYATWTANEFNDIVLAVNDEKWEEDYRDFLLDADAGDR